MTAAAHSITIVCRIGDDPPLRIRCQCGAEEPLKGNGAQMRERIAFFALNHGISVEVENATCEVCETAATHPAEARAREEKR